eukprot:11478936-Ditylum_brightwellii.AAC.1
MSGMPTPAFRGEHHLCYLLVKGLIFFYMVRGRHRNMCKRRSTYFWEDFGLDECSRRPEASSGVPISPRNISDGSKLAQSAQWSEKMVVWK